MSVDRAKANTRPDGKRLFLVTAKDLQNKTFPAIKWIVEDIIPEGLSLFCGKPKLGKSWAALDLSCAVADGTQFLGNLCEQGDVLYLALEDNERRLQGRLTKIRSESSWPANLALATQSPRLNDGGTKALEDWIAGAENPRLIIIDTLGAVRPIKGMKDSGYLDDYGALRELHRIANKHCISIIVIHHLRKAEADDPFDTVSGTTGLTGAADATLIMAKRPEDGGVALYGRGRDLKQFEHAIEFDDVRCRWKMLGDPDTVFLSDTRRAISESMQAGKETIGAIAGDTGLSEPNVRQTLRRMVAKGQAKKLGRGCYTLASGKSSDPVTTVTLSQTKD